LTEKGNVFRGCYLKFLQGDYMKKVVSGREKEYNGYENVTNNEK